MRSRPCGCRIPVSGLVSGDKLGCCIPGCRSSKAGSYSKQAPFPCLLSVRYLVMKADLHTSPRYLGRPGSRIGVAHDLCFVNNKSRHDNPFPPKLTIYEPTVHSLLQVLQVLPPAWRIKPSLPCPTAPRNLLVKDWPVLTVSIK